MTVENIQAPQALGGAVAAGKQRTVDQKRKANEKAQSRGLPLPYPDLGAAPAAGVQGGVPGAGRGTRATTSFTPLSPRVAEQAAVFNAAREQAAAAEQAIRDLANQQTPPGGAGAGAGRTGGRGAATGAGSAALGQAGATKTEQRRGMRKEIFAEAGIDTSFMQYLKESENEDWVLINDFLKRETDSYTRPLTDNQLNRLRMIINTTNTFKKAQVDKYTPVFGAYMVANGLNTTNSDNKLFLEQLVTRRNSGILTDEQVQKEIRLQSINQLGLNPDDPNLDPTKRRIGARMRDAGQTLLQAAGDYISFYASTMNMSLAEFDPFEDNGFLSAFTTSTSYDDFTRKIKASPVYLNSMLGQQELRAAKLTLQQLYRNLGLGIDPQQLDSQATNVISGQTTLQEIEYNQRNISAQAFPAFSDRILAGETINQIASPYIQSMASILEIPSSSINLSDPNNQIRQALIGDGKAAKPLWQFEQELFKDSRWQYTSNARDTIDNVTTDVLSRFGMMG